MLLATLGATRIEKAIPLDQLKLTPAFKDVRVDEDISRLQRMGYVVLDDGKVYLTQEGIIRAFSRFS